MWLDEADQDRLTTIRRALGLASDAEALRELVRRGSQASLETRWRNEAGNLRTLPNRGQDRCHPRRGRHCSRGSIGPRRPLSRIGFVTPQTAKTGARFHPRMTTTKVTTTKPNHEAPPAKNAKAPATPAPEVVEPSAELRITLPTGRNVVGRCVLKREPASPDGPDEPEPEDEPS